MKISEQFYAILISYKSVQEKWAHLNDEGLAAKKRKKKASKVSVK